MKSNCTKNSGRFVRLAAGALAAGLTLSATGSTFRVDGATGDDNNDGLFWTTPFKTVRKALNAAGSGDLIFVAAGTYYPDEINGGDSNDRADTFSLVNGVKLYGGFLNGDVFEDRDPETNITILSGDIDQDGVLDSDNSYHVVSAGLGVGLTTLVDGFSRQIGADSYLMAPDQIRERAVGPRSGRVDQDLFGRIQELHSIASRKNAERIQVPGR